MSFSQGTLLNKIEQYLKKRGREEFSSKMAPGYCHGLVLLFCYFAQIKKIDRFYELIRNANQWNWIEDKIILDKINKIKETTEWQEAHHKLQSVVAKLPTNPEPNSIDAVNEAKAEKLISQEEAKILSTAFLPDDAAIEKILGLIETLQRIHEYDPKFISSGPKLELIRDVDQSSDLFTDPYKEVPEFEDVTIIPKEKLSELISKLPENRAIEFGTGRHAIALLREKDSYIFYDSNSDTIIPMFNHSDDLAKYLLENIYEKNIGSHVPVSMEIFAQYNQSSNDYSDLKQFCDIYRKNENADFVKTSDRSAYPEDGITPLIISLTAGLSKTAASLIENKIGINTADALGLLPIHYAASNGMTTIVKLLIANGADIDQGVIQASEKLDDVSLSLHDSIRHASPLFFACVSNNIETVNMLLDNGADINKASVSGLTPLMAAIFHGHDELIKLLMSRGAKLDNVINVLSDTRYQEKKIEHLTALEYFGAIYLPNYEGFNTAILAATQSQPKIVLELLKGGVDINYANKYGVNLLHMCVMKEILNREILNFKPDVNSLAEFNPGSNQLISPLWIACYKNNAEMVKLLLEHGANPNIKNQNELPPLAKAVENGSLEIVKLLVSQGADVKNKGDETLLDIAIKKGHSHLVEFLLQKGSVPLDGTEYSHGTLELAFKHSRINESQLESISNILSWMTRNNCPIPENLSTGGNDDLILQVYCGLNNGKLSTPDELCSALGYILNKFTNPVSSKFYFTIHATEQNPVFKKLSDQFYQSTNSNFGSIKDQIQRTINENKLNKHETKFLQALDRLVDDVIIHPQANINPTPTPTIPINRV